MMMINAPNSHAHKGKKEKGRVEESVGRRRGMSTTGEWCNPVSNMLNHMCAVNKNVSQQFFNYLSAKLLDGLIIEF